jgi:hypothetical protein
MRTGNCALTEVKQEALHTVRKNRSNDNLHRGNDMQQAFDLLSFSNILELPWTISVPGLLIILVFLFGALVSLLRLRVIRAFINLVWALILAIMLSQGGQALVHIMDIQTGPATKEREADITPAFPSDFRYTV